MTTKTHALVRETQAATRLRLTLTELLVGEAEDEDVIRDTIEGETSLKELVAKVDQEILDDEALVEGIEAQIRRLKERKDRVENRIEKKKAAIVVAMGEALIKTIELPTGTLSRKNVARKVLIIDETLIPASFYKQTPSIDKKAINEAMKEIEEKRNAAGAAAAGIPWLPGCEWSNGGESLSTRRR